MKEIQLTQGQVTIVDDEDFEWLSKNKWYAKFQNHTKTFYSVRNEYKPFHRMLQMHREISRTPTGMVCDHINHNTLDNRKENLRNVTNSQNLMNRSGATIRNKLGERCISMDTNSFRVRIKADGKIVFCEWFSTIDAAIVARDKALKYYHGEFSS